MFLIKFSTKKSDGGFSVSPRSDARGLDRLLCLKYCNILELKRAPELHTGRNRYMCPLTFLQEIWFCTIFVWSIFRYNRYFWQRSALKWIFSFYCIIIIQTWQSFLLSSSTPRGDRHMHPQFFYQSHLHKLNFNCISSTVIWNSQSCLHS